MTAKTYQLSADAARSYEKQKVPAMFGPLAAATIGSVDIGENDSILDVACGTGVVARAIRERPGPQPKRVVGCDLNSGMIEVARELTADASHRYEWHEADVTNMPFGVNEFSLCFCQQGLQFFPDKLSALREIARILAPGGRLVLTVWSEISPLFASIADALRIHISDAIAAQSLTPFSFRESGAILQLLEEAGYGSVVSGELTVNRALGPAPESIRGELLANPVGVEYQRQVTDVQSAIESEIAKAIQVYAAASGYSIPQKTHLIEARLR